MTGGLFHRTGGEADGDRKAPVLLLGLALCVLVAVVYGNSLHGEFLYDDFSDILGNSVTQKLFPISDLFFVKHGGRLYFHTRPLVHLLFALNYIAGKTDPFSYHLVNVVIHALATLGLYGLVRRTLVLPVFEPQARSRITTISFIIALLWALHPLQTESVSYVTQRYESVCGLFYISSLYCFARAAGRGDSRAWQVASAGCCLLALLSKEVAVTLPIVLVLYDRAFVAGSFRAAWQRHSMFYVLLASAWAVFLYLQLDVVPRSGWAGYGISVPWWKYALNQPNVILHYLRLTLWPHPLCLDYGWRMAKSPLQMLPGILVVGALLACSLRELIRNSKTGFLATAFFLILAPTSSVMPILDLAVEHRMYLPLACVVTLLVFGVQVGVARLLSRFRIAYSRPVAIACLLLTAAVISAAGFLTILRNEDYRTMLDMWRTTVEVVPNNPRARYNLGLSLDKAGYSFAAIQQLEKSLELAPTFALPSNSLGVIYGRQGMTGRSIECFNQAIKQDPGNAQYYSNLGVSHLMSGQIDLGIENFKQAIALKGDYADAYYNLGNVYLKTRRFSLAVEYLGSARRLADHNPGYLWALAEAECGNGRPEAADRLIREAAAFDGNIQGNLTNLAWHCYATGNDGLAARYLELALKLDPGSVPAKMKLGWILSTSPSDEVRNGRKALELVGSARTAGSAQDPEYLTLLAVSCAESRRFDEAIQLLTLALAQDPGKSAPWVPDLKEKIRMFRKEIPYRDIGRTGMTGLGGKVLGLG